MSKIVTTDSFIVKAKKIHGNKYDYSKVSYLNAITKICIICPEHGEFWQTPNSHLNGNGCPKCKGKNRRMTVSEFICKAKKVHSDKYDYSKVEYVNSQTKVCIICPEHGEFWQTPSSHLQGCACPKCGKSFHYTTEEFIRRAIEIHGNKYDYSKVEYKNANTPVCIIYPEHGEFWIKPSSYLRSCRNPKYGERSNTTEDIIKKFKEIHGNKYDYSKVEYVNNKTKVCIICPEHGEFWQSPDTHLKGCGCPKCAGKNTTTQEFIEKSREVHGNKYDYSKVEYVNNKTKVCIICPEHGEFWQTPSHHLKRKQGCPSCSGNKKMSKDEFIRKAVEVHGNKYDYSKVYYHNVDTPVCIICPEHGEFWQTPYHHLKRKQGCPICKQSHMENDISNFLNENNIHFIPQCDKNTFEWLNRQSLDFYLPDYNAAIECQGEQHFESIRHFGGEEKLKLTRELDSKKYKLCKEHGVRIIYYTKLGNKTFFKKLILNKKDLFKEIKSGI